MVRVKSRLRKRLEGRGLGSSWIGPLLEYPDRVHPDPLRALRELYSGVDGFEISKREDRMVRASRGSSTYGEIMPTASLKLVEAMDMGPEDTFFDLGAGVGKVVMMAALASEAGRCVGVELAAGRARQARSVLEVAEEGGVVEPGVVEFRHEDILETDLDGATVLYTCSTAFSVRFTTAIVRRVIKLEQPVTFVSTQVLDPMRHVELVDTLRLDMSWRRRSKVYVYRING